MAATRPQDATVPLQDDEDIARERRQALNAIRLGADSAAVAERFRSVTGQDLNEQRERNQALNAIQAGADSAAVAQRFRETTGEDLEAGVQPVTQTPETRARNDRLSQNIVDFATRLATPFKDQLVENLSGFVTPFKEDLADPVGAIRRIPQEVVRQLQTAGPAPGFPTGPSLETIQQDPRGAAQELAMGVLEIGLANPVARTAGAVGKGVAKGGRRVIRRPAKAEKVSRAIAPGGAESVSRAELRNLVNQVRQTDERITRDVQRQLLSPDGRRWLAEQIQDPRRYNEAVRLIERGVSGTALNRILFATGAGAGLGAVDAVRDIF